MEFNEEWFMTIALENEHLTMLWLVDNPDRIDADTLDIFIKNSSFALQEDYGWM